MRSAIISFAIIILLFAVSCKETVVEQIPSQKGYIQLSKNQVEIGEKITAHFIKMDSVKVYSASLNKKEVTFRQLDDSTLSLVVPYSNVGNEVGNFIFYCRMKTNLIPDTVLVSSQVSYKYENLPLNAFVTWNSNEGITEFDSWKYDGFSTKGWSLSEIKDTIKITRHYLCHDECSINETLVFIDNGDNDLPQFLYAEFKRNEWMASPVNIKVIDRCKIMIDKWNKNGIFSGTFSRDDFSWAFWVRK